MVTQWGSCKGRETLRSFCARHGIGVQNFNRWCRRIEAEVPVPEVEVPPAPGPRFVGVELPRPLPCDVQAVEFVAEIRTIRGNVIRIHPSIDAAFLTRLVAAC
jgi:hypothetical protein